MSARGHQTGFGLVEVLVAVLVISIGLLGIASLQVLALKNTGSSMERSQAVIQTYSYLEYLRARRDQAVIGSLDLPMTCDPDNLPGSQVEQRRWITALRDTLGPASCGAVECQGGGRCTVTVRWNDSRAEGGLEEQELVTETLL
jgi:type IV pilus assembly protein PilV